MCLHFVGHLFRVYEEDAALRVDVEVRDEYGGEGDVVGGTDVGCPGNVVERREHHGIGELALHGLHYALHL